MAQQTDKTQETHLQTIFGEETLNKIQDSYARIQLSRIEDDFERARNEGLVFDLKMGNEVLVFLTPDDVIERFEDGLGFSNNGILEPIYELITPEDAIQRLQEKLKESKHHFKSLARKLQKERQAIKEQNDDFDRRTLGRMIAYADTLDSDFNQSLTLENR